MMVSENDYITTPEASETLGYTIQHTRRLVREGRLQGAKIGRDWMILRESVALYITQSNTSPLIPSQKRGRPRSGGATKWKSGEGAMKAAIEVPPREMVTQAQEPAKPTHLLDVAYQRTCSCSASHISCIDAKSWIKGQLGVWQFNYNGRDIRDKAVHPATFPIALARRWIDLLTHEGELVLDPFVGTGTTLVAAQDADRNAVGFDLHPGYIHLTQERLQQPRLDPGTQQLAINADAREIPKYLSPETVSLIVTSPPYANLLNRPRKNKSRRGQERKNAQYLKVEQYSTDSRDLGLLELEQYAEAMAEIFSGLLPLLKPGAHCIIDVPDMWWENRRITIHVALIEALRRVGYEFRNTVIWDRTNIVNRIGIFGWPNNYITMGTTFEYLLDFRRPPERPNHGHAPSRKRTDGGAAANGSE